MGVQDRGPAVIAADADRGVVVSAVAVPVKIDWISLEDVAVGRIHEGSVLLEVRDLLHDVDPGYTVLVPHGILRETAVIKTLGDKVRAVSASSFVTVIKRIVIISVFFCIGNVLGNIVGI